MIDEQDAQLKQLALTAQNAPPKTLERQQALSQLIAIVLNSRRLGRPYRYTFQQIYEDIYAEAKQQLFYYICENIEAYDPQREVLQWANFLLKRRFFPLAAREITSSLPKRVRDRGILKYSIDDLEGYELPDIPSQTPPSLSEKIREYIQEDPGNCLKNNHVEDYPEANFQAIALQRLSGYSWQEISDSLNLSVSTLSGFYRRSLEKLAPSLRQNLD